MSTTHNVCCNSQTNQNNISEITMSHISEDEGLQKFRVISCFTILLTRFVQLESYIVNQELVAQA